MSKPNLSRRAQAVESHWSLFNLVRENWSWVLSVIGLSGLSGYAAGAREAAANAPWYDKTLVVLFVLAGMAFLVLGAQAFLVWARRSRREDGAIASGLAWSGHTYARGSVIDGGTHHITEIFGNDQLRTDLIFRNCQISGPGALALFGCHIEKSEFFGLPGAQIVEPEKAYELGRIDIHRIQIMEAAS